MVLRVGSVASVGSSSYEALFRTIGAMSSRPAVNREVRKALPILGVLLD